MEEQLKFKVSAGLKNLIGRELITNANIAIFELVKNSYDAGASNTQIVFKSLDSAESAKIWIIDDGEGMDYNDIVNKWLFVGYSEKKSARDNYRHKIGKKSRFLAGYKGIGRFSTDRLGYKLRLYSKKRRETTVHFVEMDWSEFEKDQETEFETVNVTYDNTKKISMVGAPVSTLKHGTILEIFPLRDKWGADKLVSLKRYLQRLVNPTQDAAGQEFKIELVAEDYKQHDKKAGPSSIINGMVENLIFKKLDIKTTQIECTVSDTQVVTRLTDKGKHVYTLNEAKEAMFGELHDISIKIFYLNQSAKKSFTDTMGMQPVKFGSVLLYKNGFRIHPYGDENDDWLGLSRRKAQGYRRHISDREILGRVEIYGEQPEFTEVTSRSGGVVATTAYHQLVDFVLKMVIFRLEKYVVGGINWDTEKPERQKSKAAIKEDTIKIISRMIGKSSADTNIVVGKDLLQIVEERQLTDIPRLIKNLTAIEKHVALKDRKYFEKQIKSLQAATRKLAQSGQWAEDQIKDLTRDKHFLEKEVSDQQQLGNLHHSIKTSSQIIEGAVVQINEKAAESTISDEITRLIDEISLENQKIRSVVSILKFAKFNMKITEITDDVVSYVKEYIKTIFQTRSMKMKYSFIGQNLKMKKTFIPMKISITLDNLLDNSFKAGARTVRFRFKKLGNDLSLEVGDDGKGVPQSIQNDIFTRGFSTTSDTGIGLHHVKTMLAEDGGSIKFLGNGVADMGKGACFEVTMR